MRAKEPQAKHPVRILLVDDSEHDRHIFCRVLRRADDRYEIVECSDGETGLERLEQGDFDLLAVDYKLPGMDGIEFIRRAQPCLKDTGTLLLTGAGSEQVAAEALRLHVLDYVFKEPHELFCENLPRQIANALRHVMLERENRELTRQLRIRLKHLEQIHQVMPDAIFAVIGGNGSLREINEQARALLAVPPKAKLEGRPIGEVLSYLSEDIAELVEAHLERRIFLRNAHLEVSRTSGETRVLLLNLAPVGVTGAPAGQKPEAWVLSIRDVTSPDSVTTEKTESAIHGIVGRDPTILAVHQLIRKAAPLPSSVLVTGPTGSGKELVARAIHEESSRSRNPFVAVNCTALSGEILESELFGHVRGAFTGAIQSRKGRFREADGGTLFLDEIGDTTLSFQTKLLRTLDTGCIEPVGQDRPQKVDVRIVCATNKDLRSLIQQRKFREDLFYRINVLHIQMPSLSERPGDLPLLVEYFRRELNQRFGKAVRLVTQDAMRVLARHDWPGNVRELRHALEHAFVVADGPVITVADLPSFLGGKRTRVRSTRRAAKRRGPSVLVALPESFWNEPDEKKRIQRALEIAQFNVNEAAALLKVHRSTLWRKIRKHGLRKSRESAQ